MANKKEFEGKDVEEAIGKACATLKTSREFLTIEIVSTGSVGIFGLCRKPARVLVAKKDTREARDTKDTREEVAKPAPSPKIRAAEKAKAPARPPVKKAPEEPEVEEDQAPAGQEEQPAVVLAAEALTAIEVDVADLLRLMGMTVQVEVAQESGKVIARVTGDDTDNVVGPEGQTLDGLQYLMRKILARKYPEKITFVIDAGEFRASRKSELESQALQLAQEVKDTGKTRTIPALNPAERRIVHMLLQTDTTIRSRSVGEGLFKKILIYLPGKGGKKKPSSGRRKPNRQPRENTDTRE